MPRHYLDHASTSPARPEVVEAMLPWLTGDGAGDPGRVHTEGRMARAAVEDARDKVAAFFGARSREVVFTSGATEATNAAVWGATRSRPRGLVLAAAVEHSAVRDASARHAEVRGIPVDGLGRIDVRWLESVLDGGTLPRHDRLRGRRPEPGRAVGVGAAEMAGPSPGGNDRESPLPGDTIALVHCQWGNHEVGTLQPAEEVVHRCREAGILVHVDAAAAAGHVPVDFVALGTDLMSVSAHKFGGPKGIGALLVRRGLRLDPLVVGGDQERARRAGLENVPAIAGFGAACEAVDLAVEARSARLGTERVLAGAKAIAGVTSYGDSERRLPHIVCLGVDGVEAEAVLLGLDQAGIAVHSGSACSSEALEPSPVLGAMGVEAERSLRVSVGWSSSPADVSALLEALPRVVGRLRALSP
ncbi:MAG TPA: cysteine desulfurase family protein [Acidimicrobiales bacterium]|nr:cysteine desulfurase family protein [Acidimicrobiales bacterium]